eukprot:s4539_g8.t1
MVLKKAKAKMKRKAKKVTSEVVEKAKEAVKQPQLPKDAVNNADVEVADEASFESLGVCEELCQAVKLMKWTKPTSFCCCQRLLDDPQRFYAVCLAPTRELCVQIGEQFEAIGSTIKLQTATVVGGLAMVDQAMALAKRPHVVIATPGRLVDHLENTKGFHLKTIKYLVMDEADRLLSMDFDEALDKILEVVTAMLARRAPSLLVGLGAAFAVLPCGRAGLSLQQPVALTGLLLPSSVEQVCLRAFGVGCLLASLRPKLRAVTGCNFRNPSFKVSKASCRALTSVFSEVPSLFGFFPEPEEIPGRRFQALGPVGLQSLQLSQEVLQHLFEDALCCDVSGDVQRMHDLGFVQCVDHPNLPGHHYLEGYFHTLPGAEPFPSVNPRCGGDMLKPAASLRLRAFAEGVRRANAGFLARMAADCPENSVLRRLLEEGRAFADLAVQIHWGESVGQDDIAWHVDAPNSALHMAVSVHGRRSLKMKLRQPFELEPAIHEELQVPGDVYVGNPAAFEHGLEYPAATWEPLNGKGRREEISSSETRTVAFQLRLLINEAEMRDQDVHQGLSALAKGIAAQPLRLPGLAELRRIEAELVEAC